MKAIARAGGVNDHFCAGPAARRFLAAHPTVLQVGGTLFVHGGVLPQHAEYGLERINEETRAWIAGEGSREMPRFLGGRDAVVWARDFSQGASRLWSFPVQPWCPKLPK